MRLKSISAISVIVIIVALAALVCTPPVRMAIMDFRMRDGIFDIDPRLEQQVKERPDDPAAWLALAVAGGEPPPSGPLNAAAFERAIALQPDSPAAYLLFGSALTSEVPLLRPEELAAFSPDYAERSEDEPGALTAEQRAAITRARNLLHTAQSLDPENAAPDYLLAYLALAERRDEHALALLRSGFAKTRWGLGRREAGIAIYEAYQRTTTAVVAGIGASSASEAAQFRANQSLRELAYVITGMSNLATEQGRHERAIFLRESMMHLGLLVINQGYKLLDAWTGIAIWNVAASQSLTAAETTAALKGLPLTAGAERSAQLKRRDRAVRRARKAKFAAYLRAHGRPDLADEVIPSGDALSAWGERVPGVVMDRWHQTYALLGATFAFGGALIAAIAALAFLLLFGAAGLILSLTGRRPVPIAWAWWKWALVLLVVTAGPLISVAIRTLWRSDSSPERLFSHVAHATLGFFVATAALPLFLVLMLPIISALRRRVDADARPGFGRQYVGTASAVLLPMTALLMTLALTLCIPAVRDIGKYVAHQEVVFYQDEFAYYDFERPLAGVR